VEGVPEGFAALYGRAAPALFAWAALHVGEPLRARLDPEDVLQEVSCRAFERFDTFDPGRSSFHAWIFGRLRRRGRLEREPRPGSALRRRLSGGR